MFGNLLGGVGTFFQHCDFVVGDGKRVEFWHDCWCGDMSLKGVFPELFVLSRDREASVDDIMSFPNGILHWDLRFSKNVHDWELESLSSFMELIYSLPLKGEGDDKLGWRSNLNKGFSVKEYYRCLHMASFDHFPWKSIWRTKVPPRVAFFSWTAALERLLTIDNLRKRNLILVDWCCMCKRNGESVDHLLLHCPLAWELWSMVLGLFRVHWVMLCHVLDFWAGWQGHYGNHCNLVVWRMVPHCVMWCLWRERNGRHFEDCKGSVSALILLFFHTLYEWVFSLGIFSINSMTDLIDYCSF